MHSPLQKRPDDPLIKILRSFCDCAPRDRCILHRETSLPHVGKIIHGIMGPHHRLLYQEKRFAHCKGITHIPTVNTYQQSYLPQCGDVCVLFTIHSYSVARYSNRRQGRSHVAFISMDHSYQQAR